MINQKEKKRIEGLSKKAREFLINEIPRRRKECEAEGHKKPYETQYVISSDSRYTDKVSCGCQYCLGSWERNLNESEARGIQEFYKSMREPMTI